MVSIHSIKYCQKKIKQMKQIKYSSRKIRNVMAQKYSVMRLMGMAILFSLFHFSVNAQQQATTINFNIKDQNTGFAITNAAIIATTPTGKTIELKASTNGKKSYTIVKGRYDFYFSAKGYKPLQTYFKTETSETIEAEINLDPITDDPVSKYFTENTEKVTKFAIIQGYVSDKELGKPIANVSVKAGNYEVKTNNEGFFKLSIPAHTVAQDETPEKINIIFSKYGYKTYIKQGFYLLPETYSLKVSLTSFIHSKISNHEKTPEIIEVQKHGMFDRTEAEEESRYQDTSNETLISENKISEKVRVPSSIKVGINCSCTSCSSVKVMSLEAYVQSGLDDEWIPSWRSNSLKSGAVAYRSYGAWYVLHPVKSSYDIASTTCNQVWSSDISDGAKNAAIATSGQVLLKGGAIFRSEYSSENNNAGCGDGFSGTGSGWPCISDIRCKGTSKFGHGRGLCQYGSQRWSSDKDYLWILDHYYTPGGVSVSGGCQISLNLDGVIESGSYESSDRISASGTIASGRSVAFDTRNSITLTNGFVAAAGSSFSAKIGGGCSTLRILDQITTDNLADNDLSMTNKIVNLYPNPASDNITIEYNALEKSAVVIELIDFSGRTVSNLSHNNQIEDKNEQKFSINTSALPSGMYFVKIKINGLTTDTKTIIINK
jgi:hypothetical protein